MAKSSSQRVADYRARRKAEGMVQLNLVVPAEDAGLFAQFAEARRKNHRADRQTRSAPREQWQAMLEALLPRVANAEAGLVQPTPRALSRPRADVVVDGIVKRIVELGWPVGLPLGSEQELMRQYSASRTVLRQSIRLLEHHSIARMRRGPNGGLVVARPDLRATAQAAAFYLEYAHIEPRDILTTRRILELATVELVIERLDDEGIEQLRAQIEAEAGLDGSAETSEFLRFHFLLGELCGDPALRLFSGVVLQLANAHSTFHSRSAEDRDAVAKRITRFHRDIAQAIVAKDTAVACAQMARYFAGMRAWLT